MDQKRTLQLKTYIDEMFAALASDVLTRSCTTGRAAGHLSLAMLQALCTAHIVPYIACNPRKFRKEAVDKTAACLLGTGECLSLESCRGSRLTAAR